MKIFDHHAHFYLSISRVFTQDLARYVCARLDPVYAAAEHDWHSSAECQERWKNNKKRVNQRKGGFVRNQRTPLDPPLLKSCPLHDVRWLTLANCRRAHGAVTYLYKIPQTQNNQRIIFSCVSHQENQ